jgi:hypothetical protein
MPQCTEAKINKEESKLFDCVSQIGARMGGSSGCPPMRHYEQVVAGKRDGRAYPWPLKMEVTSRSSARLITQEHAK